jgi:hypothetical protein
LEIIEIFMSKCVRSASLRSDSHRGKGVDDPLVRLSPAGSTVIGDLQVVDAGCDQAHRQLPMAARY